MKQSFSQWQSNPAQGAMPSNSPFTPADEAHLIEVVIECRIRLKSALQTAEGYRARVPELATVLADAFTSCQQATAILNDLLAYSDVNAEILCSSGEQDHHGGDRVQSSSIISKRG